MSMQAVVLREHGGPEVLREEQLPIPQPGPGEVLVRVRAVALNHMDLWVRKGGPAFKLEYPHRLGCDMAGEIAGAGPSANIPTDLSIGTRVMVYPGISCGNCAACLSGRDNFCRLYRLMGENAQGGYSEYHVVPRTNVLPIPSTLSFANAAAVPLTFVTAWQMLVRRADVKLDEWVLVHGAGSGVGVAAIQIAKLFGARVIATASTDAKLARARALGADETINYATEDFVPRVKAITEKRGADVVIEHVGGENFAKSILATRHGGRIVTCGATSAFFSNIDLRHVFFRQLSLLGSTMGSKADLHAILPHVLSGRLKPVVDRELPLSQAQEAHRALEAREAFGKIVLLPGT